MPTYDYECITCSHQFEQFQAITAKPLKKCPECGGKVKRLIGSGAGIIFKGSGFYETDYKRKNSNFSSSSASKAEGKSDVAKSETKKESKPSAD